MCNGHDQLVHCCHVVGICHRRLQFSMWSICTKTSYASVCMLRVLCATYRKVYVSTLLHIFRVLSRVTEFLSFLCPQKEDSPQVYHGLQHHNNFALDSEYDHPLFWLSPWFALPKLFIGVSMSSCGEVIKCSHLGPGYVDVETFTGALSNVRCVGDFEVRKDCLHREAMQGHVQDTVKNIVSSCL